MVRFQGGGVVKGFLSVFNVFVPFAGRALSPKPFSTDYGLVRNFCTV